MNWIQLQDPLLQQACERSGVQYGDLGLPREITVWVDPGEVSCRLVYLESAGFVAGLGGVCLRSEQTCVSELILFFNLNEKLSRLQIKCLGGVSKACFDWFVGWLQRFDILGPTLLSSSDFMQ